MAVMGTWHLSGRTRLLPFSGSGHWTLFHLSQFEQLLNNVQSPVSLTERLKYQIHATCPIGTVHVRLSTEMRKKQDVLLPLYVFSRGTLWSASYCSLFSGAFVTLIKTHHGKKKKKKIGRGLNRLFLAGVPRCNALNLAKMVIVLASHTLPSFCLHSMMCVHVCLSACIH